MGKSISLLNSQERNISTFLSNSSGIADTFIVCTTAHNLAQVKAEIQMAARQSQWPLNILLPLLSFPVNLPTAVDAASARMKMTSSKLS